MVLKLVLAGYGDRKGLVGPGVTTHKKGSCTALTVMAHALIHEELTSMEATSVCSLYMALHSPNSPLASLRLTLAAGFPPASPYRILQLQGLLLPGIFS